MRRIPLLLLLLATFSQAVNAMEYDHDYLETKLHKFQGMRTGGFTMAGLGGAALIGGIFLASNGKYETVETVNGTQSQAKDGSAVGGILLIGLGIPLAITGIVLGSIGNKKAHQYEAMLQNASLDLQLGQRKGARLTYNF
jgi:hypothetical protein